MTFAASMKFTLGVALLAMAVTAWAQDDTAKVRKVQAQAASQGAQVNDLRQRVDSLEANSARADADLKAKDQAIADLERQLAQARAATPAPVPAGASSAGRAGR
jgi:septal ring factor EnvC (AmiA/AmiB activator)